MRLQRKTKLLKKIEEFGKSVIITGFRNVKLRDVETFLENIRKEKPSNVAAQFFDARFVATWKHLYFAVLNALTAFKNKENISKSLAMEAMLHASGQHQIQKAMAILKVKPESSEIAVLIIAEQSESAKAMLSMVSKLVNSEPDDTVLELSDEKVKNIKRVFNISEVEISAIKEKNHLEEALTALVIERMALLATRK
jgi:KEOPS complex subunit Cgi121